MLENILKEKRCFKLVCGAGNEDPAEVEKLVYIYSKAGANFFDISAKINVLEAAKRGLERSGNADGRYFCISLGIKGDPHVTKYCIDTEKCKKCGKCLQVCPQKAIIENPLSYKIKKNKCIGCGKCEKNCAHDSIQKYSEQANLKNILPPLIAEGIDCIEFHIMGESDSEIYEKWDYINSVYDGMLSICIDRTILGDRQIVDRILKMLELRKSWTTIIQADGTPMSGVKNDYKTTLQAVAMAEIIQNANLPVYILLSGGTNAKTSELAGLCGIDFNGIAIGTYARQIVHAFVNRDDFWDNKDISNSAIEVAKSLVDITLKNA